MSSNEALPYLIYPKLDGDELQLNLAGQKSRAWVSDEKEAYVLGDIISESGKTAVIKLDNGEEREISVDKVEYSNPSKFDGVDDLGQLSHLNQPSVLHNLKQRYFQNIIYTYSGLFCVVINPYRWLPIYSPEVVKMYSGKTRSEMPPHVYAITDGAYRNMINGKCNQSILITGESGAGKTENTKKVIQYLAIVGGRAGGQGELEQQVLNTNPILEAFGNAKTVRNDNSSRFGKFIEIHFDRAGLISGASIRTYLLEKSRVVSPNENERSFHIFYQLLEGSSPEEKEKYLLEDPENFELLTQSGCLRVSSVDDVEDFRLTKKAMDIMGISLEEQENVFKIVASILHLKNIVFIQNRKEESSVKNPEALDKAAILLGCSASKLEDAFCNPKIKAGFELVTSAQNAVQASEARDALCRALYSRCFEFLVKKINKTLSRGHPANFIGVLDIAGFEIFQKNSFEQLCINYTNEKLQQFFNNHMFKLEQEEYEREHIKWSHIDFGMDLQPTIDLIEKKPSGVLVLLEEECIFPNGTDESFVDKVAKNHEKSSILSLPRHTKTSFNIKHYAGEVTYDTERWLNKNRDPLQEDLKKLMLASSIPLIMDIFDDHFLAAGNPSSAANSRRRESDAGVRGKKGAKFQFVSTKHREQLNELMVTLFSTEPHFIRCIVPNFDKRPLLIEPHLVLDQLRCNGVLEGIRITRKGFPNRVVFESFAKQYDVLCPQNGATDFRTRCMNILRTAGFTEEHHQIGLTKVFFKAGELARMEDLRTEKLGQLIVVIQKHVRGYQARRRYEVLLKQLKAAKIIQQTSRNWLLLKDWVWWEPFCKLRNAMPAHNQMKQKEEEMQRLNDKYKSMKSKLQEEVERLSVSLEQEQNKLGNLENTKKKLEQELEDAKQAVEEEMMTGRDRAKTIASLEEEIEKLNEDLDIEEENKERITKSLQKVTGERDALKDELEALADAKNSIEKARKVLEIEVEELKDQLEDETEQRASLDSLLKNTQAELETAKKTVTTLTAKNKDLEKEIDSVEAELNDLQDALDSETAGRTSAENKAKALQKELAELEAAALEQDKKNKAMAEKLKKKLEGDLNDAKKEIEDKTHSKASTEQALRDLESDLSSMQEDLDQTEQALSSAEKKVKTLSAQVRTLEDDLDVTQANYMKAQNQIKDLQARIAELEEQLEETEAKLAASLDENAKLNQEIVTLKAQVADTSAMDKMSQAQKKLQKEMDDLLDEADEEKRRLKAQFESTNSKLQTEVEELTDALENEKRMRQTTEKSLKKSQAQAQESEVNVVTMKAELRALEAKVNASVENEDALQDQIDELMEKNSKLASKSRQLAVEVENLEEQLETSERSRGQLQEQVRTLEAEKADLTDALEDLEAKSVSSEKLRLAEADLAELKIKLEAAQKAEHAAKVSAMDKLENALADAEEERDMQTTTLTKNIRKLQAELAESQAATEAAQHQLSVHEKNSKKYSKDLKEVTEKLAGAEKEKQAAQERALRLQEDLDALNTRMDEVEFTAKQQMDRLKKQHEDEMQLVRDEIETTLTQRLSSTQARAQEEITALQAQLEEEMDNKKLADSALTKAQAEANSLRSQLDALNGSSSKTEKQTRSLRRELDTLRDQLEDEERAHENAERTRRKLQLELDDVKTQLEKSNARVLELERDSKKKESDLKELRSATSSETMAKEAMEADVRRFGEGLKNANKRISKLESAIRRAKEDFEELKEAKRKSRQDANKYRVQLGLSSLSLEDTDTDLTYLDQALAGAPRSRARTSGYDDDTASVTSTSSRRPRRYTRARDPAAIDPDDSISNAGRRY
eukprot:GCRY01001026.1.p1 GENE.GCRY01001026.1~~GCRY01001026.1.p1  ORF type:complete len:1811 (+),score=621.26 GCRY01001026.1:127-5559(+)